MVVDPHHAAQLVGTLLKVVQALIKGATNAQKKSSEFKSRLEQLESSLKSLVPKINEMEKLNDLLDHFEQVDFGEFMVLLREGEKLVNRCAQAAGGRNYSEICQYSNQIAEFDAALCRFAQLNFQVEMTKLWMTHVVESNIRSDELMYDKRAATWTAPGTREGGAVGFQKLTANIAAINIVSIDQKTVQLVAEVVAKNSNPIPIPLVGIRYLIESNGRKLLSGLFRADECATINWHGPETKIKVRLTVNYDDIKNRYNDIKSGTVIPYKVCMVLIANVPGIGKITLRIEKEAGEMPVPRKLSVSVEDEIWHSTGHTQYLKLKDKNDFNLVINAVDYEHWIGSKRAGWAQLAESIKIQKKAEGEGVVIEVPIIDDENFGFWNTVGSLFYPHSIKGIIHVNTIFGPMKFPFSRKLGIDLYAEDDTHDED